MHIWWKPEKSRTVMTIEVQIAVIVDKRIGPTKGLWGLCKVLFLGLSDRYGVLALD